MCKLLQEAKRCLKCQKFSTSHFVAQCPQTTDMCGTCGSKTHCTQAFPVDDLAQYHCPTATNPAMCHGTKTAQHLKHTTIDFNRKTRKITCIFTHLAGILNPRKPRQQQMRIIKAWRSPLHHHASDQPTPLHPNPTLAII